MQLSDTYWEVRAAASVFFFHIQLMSLCLRALIYKDSKTRDSTQLTECLSGVNAALGLILCTE